MIEWALVLLEPVLLTQRIFDSIWNIEERIDGEYVLRESDLARFLIWLREGECLGALGGLASVKGTPAALASRLGAVTIRYLKWARSSGQLIRKSRREVHLLLVS